MVVYRGRVYTPLGDPFAAADQSTTYAYHEDGYVAVTGGIIKAVGAYRELGSEWRDAELVDFGRDAIISPGFVDTHLHAPQLEMIGSYGGHLLEWLNRYTFPTEMQFSDEHHARKVARATFKELLKNGTTSALLFSTTHTRATEIFFEEAESSGHRSIIGKTLMDRNAPDGLLQQSSAAYEESRTLIQKWHKRGRLGYAITPRFAPTCTPELLTAAGELKREFPDLWVHTHISENIPEVKWVHELFPDQPSYAKVYDAFGLLTRETVLAHGVHLSDDELALIAARRASISHCPNSNLFLGSGLFPLRKVMQAGVSVGLGSDIGAGTTPSLFTAMADAYKVQQVRGVSLTPYQLWYLATLAGARALSLDGKIGTLEPGREADFIVLDLRATSLLALRTDRAQGVEDLLAGLIFIGDDRVVMKTYVGGDEAHRA